MTSSAVILDVDGTLVDSNDAHAQAWVAAFNESGIDASYDRVRRSIGMGGDKLMPHVAGIAADSPEGKRISTRRGEIFRDEYLPHLEAFPRVRELVERFAADGHAVVIASSAQADELESLLKVARIDDLITTSASSSDARRSKPDPDIVHAALQRSGADPQRAIMLGDTPYDVEAALRAGIAIVAVESGGWHAGELAGAVEVHPGAAEICAHYTDTAFARLVESARRAT
jgi:HAD superfamily hydrolase (TIGR01509 family)